jgi:hypothetical protein
VRPKNFLRPGLDVYDESTFLDHLLADGAHIGWRMIIERMCSNFTRERPNTNAKLKVITEPRSSKKRKKKQELAKPVNLDDAFATGLATWNCPQLKAYLRANSLPVSGNKNVLVERILKHHKANPKTESITPSATTITASVPSRPCSKPPTKHRQQPPPSNEFTFASNASYYPYQYSYGYGFSAGYVNANPFYGYNQ